MRIDYKYILLKLFKMYNLDSNVNSFGINNKSLQDNLFNNNGRRKRLSYARILIKRALTDMKNNRSSTKSRDSQIFKYNYNWGHYDIQNYNQKHCNGLHIAEFMKFYTELRKIKYFDIKKEISCKQIIDNEWLIRGKLLSKLTISLIVIGLWFNILYFIALIIMMIVIVIFIQLCIEEIMRMNQEPKLLDKRYLLMVKLIKKWNE